MLILYLAALVIVMIGIYMYSEAHRNQVIETELNLDGFPNSFDGVKLFFISDIHFRKIDETIIDQIQGKVDLIIIGGDLMEKRVPFGRAEENIKRLRSIGPVYFVWGNNDYEGDFRKLDAMLLENDVTILDNTAVSFEQAGEVFNLLGVDDVGHHRDRLDLALQDSQLGYKILISHNPDVIQNVSSDDEIGLLLSGHTHGGQIRLFGFGLGDKGGLKRVGNQIIFISNGYGTTRVPFRLGAPAETHLFTLRSGTKTSHTN